MPEESNAVKHARREMELAGWFDETKDGHEMQKIMADHLLLMVKTFADEGHSGFSASYAIGQLERLLRQLPLTPLTGEDSEWHACGDGILQNIRHGSVFKYPDGRVHDSNARVFVDPSGAAYTSSGSRVPVTFPYTPPTHPERVQVDGDDRPIEGASA